MIGCSSLRHHMEPREPFFTFAILNCHTSRYRLIDTRLYSSGEWLLLRDAQRARLMDEAVVDARQTEEGICITYVPIISTHRNLRREQVSACWHVSWTGYGCICSQKMTPTHPLVDGARSADNG
ncbi:hypothetical protein IF1G_10850 [Cordyceps javanica]|uniref:Uncharacterized protein n=1 Tax=Cordyceps javanica TaxID=43265 RepID=A0A545UM55_9HYPO|nr:hypothetical protein IF1G_10850 [Cordyceps javanica]